MDKLIIEHFTKNKQTKTIMEGILDSYDYKLPLVVAEYFCYAFYRNITCKQRINHALLTKFLDYKDSTKFIFSQSYSGQITLDGIEILIPEDHEYDFMDKYSNYIFSTSPNTTVEFNDSDRNYKFNVNETYSTRNKSGICKIFFD
jgi:hypothetical protein